MKINKEQLSIFENVKTVVRKLLDLENKEIRVFILTEEQLKNENILYKNLIDEALKEVSKFDYKNKKGYQVSDGSKFKIIFIKKLEEHKKIIDIKLFFRIFKEKLRKDGINLNLINFELAGRWLWLNTKNSNDLQKYANILKKYGFKYSSKKEKWYLTFDKPQKISKIYSNEEIKAKYGIEAL